ncbi:MAG: AAA family ATPase [Deltaproteobacteria bacterium]|nr:AAA family ATPase [Deltaproteobacteria bacterium]
MRISRVRIENFRNFSKLDVKLGEHAVIVGENKVGKSNFLRALRIVLDPSLPDSARMLRPEDFWDGLTKPLAAGTKILIAIDLEGFDSNCEQLASLADFLVDADPMVARLTYAFRRSSGGTDFEFVVYGGDREEARVTWEVRRRLALELIPALRDAENDLASWQRSPLRPLLTKMADAIAQEEKDAIAAGVATATQSILERGEVKALGELVSKALKAVVGGAQAVDVELGLAPTNADRLLRSLRLLIDGGLRGIGEASLGVANTLYLTLKLLEARQLVQDGARDHTFLAIEEPEAHLHPHVQRRVFSSILAKRAHFPRRVAEPAVSQTVILTTHSPYIASVAPLRALVLLRSTANGTVAVSSADIDLDTSDEEDLERYLDVTRAEILFARAVLLVEGDAELFVIPKLAEFAGIDLDGLGITICSVGGTHFTPHVKLLRALEIPFAVVTDKDPTGEGENLGENRVVELLSHIMAHEDYKKVDRKGMLVAAAANGVFLGEATFELDLLRSGRAKSMSTALVQLAPGKTARTRAAAWATAKAVSDELRFLKDIEAIGKGRYAQRLAATMKKKGGGAQGPEYIMTALTFLKDRVPS